MTVLSGAPADLIQTVGRRKEAIVRVRLVPGTGQYKLNGRTLEEYFPNKVHQQAINEPFVTLEKAEQYDVIARLHGGGVSGQAGALRLAIARVRLVPGSGTWKINGRQLDEYFPNKVHQQAVNEPFRVTDLEGRFDVIARIHGGGTSGQAGALRLGVARALNEIDHDANRPSLKKAGFLTRDPRAKERKKAGLKKARKAPQYSKR